MTSYVVSAGEILSGTGLASGDTMVVESGGVAISTTITNGGQEFVYSGGSVSGLTLGVGGNLYVDAGGTAVGAVLDGGNAFVYGGETISTTIGAGSQEYVYFGGVAADGTVSSGGSLVIGDASLASGIMVQGGTISLGAGGIDSGSTLISGGYEIVSAGGSAFTIVVSSGGTEFVSSGATVSGITVEAGGLMDIEAGAIVSGLTNDGGTVAVPCFAAGTLIMTEAGPVPVERLTVGQRLPTHAGETLPILWIGQRTVDCQRHPAPGQVLPVAIAAHAFGADRPSSDLLLSPDHAIFAEGVLIPVRHLVDGEAIRQVETASITYFHVELSSHSVIWAEGLPVETYLDTGDRHAFIGGSAALALHPSWGSKSRDITLIMEALGYAPLRVAGPEVAKVKAAVAGNLTKRMSQQRTPRQTRKRG